MAWRRPGDKPVSEQMMFSLLYASFGLNELITSGLHGNLIVNPTHIKVINEVPGTSVVTTPVYIAQMNEVLYGKTNATYQNHALMPNTV